MDYNRKSQRKGRSVGGRSLKSRESKSLSAHTRQKTGKTYWEDEDSSGKDSENESDDDFKSSGARGGINFRKSNSSRSTMSANVTNQNGEVRSSSRSMRKISYAESEESEDITEGKAKRGSQKVRIIVKLSIPCFFFLCLISMV